MLPFQHTFQDRSGSTLVVVVLVLMAVTVMGLAAINFSTIDINLASNEKWQKTGFYNGDSGFHGSPAVMGVFFEHRFPKVGDPDDPDNETCLMYLNGMDNVKLDKLVTNTTVGETGCEDNEKKFKDISFRACDLLADVDICPTETAPLAGEGIEFAAAAEGVGLGAGANIKLFRITSTGDGASNSSTYTVYGHYGWVDKSGGIR